MDPTEAYLIHLKKNRIQKCRAGGWRNDSAVKSTGCSLSGPEFDSQHPHDILELSVTPVPGDLIPAYILAGKTPICIQNKIN